MYFLIEKIKNMLYFGHIDYEQKEYKVMSTKGEPIISKSSSQKLREAAANVVIRIIKNPNNSVKQDALGNWVVFGQEAGAPVQVLLINFERTADKPAFWTRETGAIDVGDEYFANIEKAINDREDKQEYGMDNDIMTKLKRLEKYAGK